MEAISSDIEEKISIIFCMTNGGTLQADSILYLTNEALFDFCIDISMIIIFTPLCYNMKIKHIIIVCLIQTIPNYYELYFK